MSSVLQTKNLTKEYSSERGAIDISIDIKEGEIVGFVGPNGAGKSTTMEMIMSLINPDYGSREIFGNKINSKEDFFKVVNKIGYLPAEGGLYEHLTANETFNYASKLYGLNLNKEIKNYSEILKLDREKPIKKLSLGNKKKVGIIQSIIHNPRLLILDEPTSGLDPLIQNEILKIIKNFSEKKTAIFLSSHNLSEVQSICDRIIMIKDSKIIFDGNVHEILHSTGREIILMKPPKIILDRIINIVGTESIEEKEDGSVILTLKRTSSVVKVLLEYDFEDYYIQKPSLESKFIDFY